MKLIVVIPTYNEVENMVPLLSAIAAAIPGTGVLIVDDASPDGTVAAAERAAEGLPLDLRVLRRGAKNGLGTAYVEGFARALDEWPAAEAVAQMDADLSHDPAYLPAMLDQLREVDVVIGSRYVNGISIVNWPLHRLMVSKIGTAYARLTTGLPVTDCTSGFKCFRADALRNLDLRSIGASGYAFQIEMSFRAWQSGYRLAEVPIIFYERRFGESKLDLSIALEAFITGLRLLAHRTVSPRISRRDTPTHAPSPD